MTDNWLNESVENEMLGMEKMKILTLQDFALSIIFSF